VVGANGFEPSTSWSRTKSLNPINALSGVAYGTRDLMPPLLVVRNLYVALQTWSLNPSVNSRTTNFIRTCRSWRQSKEISKFQLNSANHFLLLYSPFVRIFPRLITISTTFLRQSKLRQKHAPFSISPMGNFRVAHQEVGQIT